MGSQRFPSKRDGWIVGILYGSIVLVVVVFAGAWPGLGGLERAICVGLSALTFGFLAWTLYGTGYGFEDGCLIARSGPFRFRVELAGIVEVVPSRNPLSSPACSLDRLHVRTEKGRGLLISPLDKAGFLASLVAAAPHLVVEGDRVRRAA